MQMENAQWMQALSLLLTLYVAYTVYQNHRTQLTELKTGHKKIRQTWRRSRPNWVYKNSEHGAPNQEHATRSPQMDVPTAITN